MANLKTSVIPLADLVPDAANVRLHPERNQQGVTASLRQFGPGRSIVLDGKNIVRAGNRTVASAQDAGIDEVIVVEPAANQLVAVRRPEWSPTEATAYGVADNRSAELAAWDFEALGNVLRSLQAEAVDLGSLGWADHELEPILAANWTPPELTEIPGDNGHNDQDSDAHAVIFPSLMWVGCLTAIERLRSDENDSTISESQAIDMILADWLSAK